MEKALSYEKTLLYESVREIRWDLADTLNVRDCIPIKGEYYRNVLITDTHYSFI